MDIIDIIDSMDIMDIMDIRDIIDNMYFIDIMICMGMENYEQNEQNTLDGHGFCRFGPEFEALPMTPWLEL